MRRTIGFDDRKKIDDIIRRCNVCHLGMVDENNLPYVLPFNFGYDNGIVYLHSAQQGRKMDILRNRPEVCAAFSTDYELRAQHEEVACSYQMKYRSVQVFGKIEFIEDPDEKAAALNHIMKQYTGKEFSYGLPSLKEVAVYRIAATRYSGREHGY